MTTQFTFEQLFQAFTQMYDKLERIDQYVLSQDYIARLEEDKLLTIREAAEILHLSVPTIYGLVQRQEVPVCKKGNRLYFSKIELTSWIQAGRKKTVAEITAEAENYLQLRNKRQQDMKGYKKTLIDTGLEVEQYINKKG
jgi:excisionase family DNA binding protein